MNDEKRGSHLSTEDMVVAAEKQEEMHKMHEEQIHEADQTRDVDSFEPLFEQDYIEDYRSRWSNIQTRFVDDPKDSVRDADELVAEVIKNIAEIFAEERSYLEEQWKQGSQVSTEDLRISLTRYRAFFNRLLSMGK